MDFLCKAVNDKLISETDGDDFIKKVIASGSRLPVKKWGDYVCTEVTV
jgi:hypothetical protein